MKQVFEQNAGASGYKPKVLIVGAGLGGLTLAQVFRKNGVPFEIFERDEHEVSRAQGWSLTIHSVLDDMARAFPDDMPDFRDAVHHLNPLALETQVVFYYHNDRLGTENSPATPTLRANRRLLRKWLATNVDVQYGRVADKIERLGDAMVVTFKNGTTATGDLVVGADGANSMVREHVLGKPNSEVLERVPISSITGETRLSGEQFVRQLEVAHSLAIVPVTTGDAWNNLFLGLTAVAPDGRSGEFFWILSWHDPLAQQTGRFAVNTLPTRDRLEVAKKMVAHLDPKFRRMIDETPARGVRDVGWMPSDCHLDAVPLGRAVLLGDAVHLMMPYKAEGGIHAIRDALHLGKLVSELAAPDDASLFRALTTFYAEMLPRGAEAVNLSRYFQENFRKDATAVKAWGHPVRSLPDERLEIGPEGVRSITKGICKLKLVPSI
ncbi:FAD/NAD(P)-binding domain-containing protein [Durotheca rogersii]|uniref:FAD/NAD(P)-binding domain-containing protein n=1 Tax=Durotheca rogersii TaxID=419775 RepID=UPI0022207788|nr:FAD/NAD(P)-binding domain-containing protein [Durotheca rogersii]KAI5866507.1 FAD/NAD(P)-binding domain-containing protein [Durotheca rogersii]